MKCYYSNGDNMKIILKSFLFISIGFIIGSIIFNNNKDLFKNFTNTNTYYFLLEGIYNNEESMQENIKNIKTKVIEKKDNYYEVYVGITRDKEVLNKLINIYKDLGYQVTPKEKDINSISFKINLEQFDTLLKDAIDNTQVFTIEEIILSNYKEIKKNSSKTK